MTVAWSVNRSVQRSVDRFARANPTNERDGLTKKNTTDTFITHFPYRVRAYQRLTCVTAERRRFAPALTPRSAN